MKKEFNVKFVDNFKVSIIVEGNDLEQLNFWYDQYVRDNFKLKNFSDADDEETRELVSVSNYFINKGCDVSLYVNRNMGMFPFLLFKLIMKMLKLINELEKNVKIKRV